MKPRPFDLGEVLALTVDDSLDATAMKPRPFDLGEAVLTAVLELTCG